jgi:hypothetical protein
MPPDTPTGTAQSRGRGGEVLFDRIRVETVRSHQSSTDLAALAGNGGHVAFVEFG